MIPFWMFSTTIFIPPNPYEAEAEEQNRTLEYSGHIRKNTEEMLIVNSISTLDSFTFIDFYGGINSTNNLGHKIGIWSTFKPRGKQSVSKF